MLQAIDPVTATQMALTAGADIAFAFAVGACALGLGGAARMRVIRVAMLVWLVLQGFYLPLQASAMSGAAPYAALPMVPLVITQSHFGVMWAVGVTAGIVALATAFTKACGRATWSASTVLLAAALMVMAFTHAGTTHAVDAGDFSIAMLVHTVHLLSTGLWAGVVVVAAWPLRRLFVATRQSATQYSARLSRLAALAFLVAIGTGIANAWRGLGGSLAPLTSSLWGWVLCVKLLAVACVVAIGALNRFLNKKRIRQGDPDALSAFGRWLAAEAYLMIVVLILASVLGHSMPAATG
ncbi:MAG: CopD family protein [Rhodoferax sp.]